MSITQNILNSGARLPPLPTIRDLIRLYKLRAIKQLSQNFLMDERLTDKIVKAAGKMEGHHVLEVGPGPGGITRSIIRNFPKHLVVVEKDRRFLPTLELLSEACKNQIKMDIVRGDILKYSTETAFPDCEKTPWDGPKAPIHMIGNLPFAISTRLLINWLRDISLQQGVWSLGRASLTLTFQKEVAERIVAIAGASQRCRLSVMSQIWTKPEFRFTISGSAFVPKPDVNVGVVTMLPYKAPMTDFHFDLVEKVVRHIFSMRQKYCRRGVATLFPEDVREEFTELIFKLADVDPMIRPFQLSIEEHLRIIGAYKQVIQQHPQYEHYNFRACKKDMLEFLQQLEDSKLSNA